MTESFNCALASALRIVIVCAMAIATTWAAGCSAGDDDEHPCVGYCEQAEECSEDYNFEDIDDCASDCKAEAWGNMDCELDCDQNTPCDEWLDCLADC